MIWHMKMWPRSLFPTLNYSAYLLLNQTNSLAWLISFLFFWPLHPIWFGIRHLIIPDNLKQRNLFSRFPWWSENDWICLSSLMVEEYSNQFQNVSPYGNWGIKCWQNNLRFWFQPNEDRKGKCRLHRREISSQVRGHLRNQTTIGVGRPQWLLFPDLNHECRHLQSDKDPEEAHGQRVSQQWHLLIATSFLLLSLIEKLWLSCWWM